MSEPNGQSTDTAITQITGNNTIYTGLSDKARLWIIVVSAVFALSNLAGAWYFGIKSNEIIKPTLEDNQIIASLTSDIHDETNKTAARAYIYGIHGQLKLITNKQAIVIAGFGGAFAMMAIGFALFLIGADGAFKVEASAPAEKGNLVIQGTAPGLLCFILAAALMGLGLSRKHDLSIGGINFSPAAQPVTVEQECPNKTDSGCMSTEALETLK